MTSGSRLPRKRLTIGELNYYINQNTHSMVFINTVIIVVGTLLIVNGINLSLYLPSLPFFKATDGNFLLVSVLCACLGLILLPSAIFGFYVTYKQNIWLVKLYAAICLTIFIITFNTLVLSLSTGYDDVQKNIYIPIEKYAIDNETQNAIDNLQISFNCCGATSFEDYAVVDLPVDPFVTTSVVANGTGDVVSVPLSCCLPVGYVPCPAVRATGCKRALTRIITNYSMCTIALFIGLSFVLFFSFTTATILAFTIRDLKNELALADDFKGATTWGECFSTSKRNDWTSDPLSK